MSSPSPISISSRKPSGSPCSASTPSLRPRPCPSTPSWPPSSEAGLPSLLNHYFLLAGRISTNPSSGFPEVHCSNQGAELVVGEAAAGVALASLNYAETSASLRRIQLPYGDDVALSVQVVSFSCGGFTVAWSTNHLLVDGRALSSLVGAWSELALSGKSPRCPAGRTSTAPCSGLARRRRMPPPPRSTRRSRRWSVDARSQVNVLTFQQSFVERMYHVDARPTSSGCARRRAETAGARLASRPGGVGLPLEGPRRRGGRGGRTRCRMGWWVDGRPRLTSPPRGLRTRTAMRNCVGNVTTFVLREERVDDVASGGAVERGRHGERGDHGAGVQRALPGAGGLGGGAQDRAGTLRPRASGWAAPR